MSGESLHVRHEAGAEMIIAIDSTARGPALGGCRWRPYPDTASARRDAWLLARAMTRKASMARLSLGGGKAVVAGDARRRTDEQLRAFGDFVHSLGGRYITAADVGTGEETMAVIGERTRFVAGLPRRLGGSGDPGPLTALGVHMAMTRACAHRDRKLAGARVSVQGVGSVGSALVGLLIESGAHVLAADVDDATLDALPDEVERVPAAELLTRSCDVFAPCGLGGVIDREVARVLDCAVICGAANNTLTEPELASVLEERDILYVPDFVSNAGGLIHLAMSLDGGDEAASRRALEVIPENLDAVLERAKAEQIDSGTAAERIAAERISSSASSG